jgi:cell division protease FtsH
MAIDPWLPVGFVLPDGGRSRAALFEGPHWQIFEREQSGRVLVVDSPLSQRWIDSCLIDDGTFQSFSFGSRQLRSISSSADEILGPVADGESPNTHEEALAFAQALSATRAIDPESALQDALYVARIGRLLPTYSLSSRVRDEVVLGYWLTGGASIRATSFRRLAQTLTWLPAASLKEVVLAAGLHSTDTVSGEQRPAGQPSAQRESPKTAEPDLKPAASAGTKTFELAGRPDLAAFFNEHIVDIVMRRERYKALGIEFPSAVILHGPPGCGKTFAVERLIDFLGWPSFEIDASSVASPYIHETSKKVAQVFEKAIEGAPSVLVIDEMEAFLADREMGTGHHRVEEMAEFLRRIPEAVRNEVLVIAMTNRIDMIDPAIQRRGRFDHVIKVDFASEIEILALLDKLLAALPKEGDVHSNPLAKELAGRPLSDVTFVVREGARLAARAGRDRLDQASLLAALKSSPARAREGSDQPKRRIGFV